MNLKHLKYAICVVAVGLSCMATKAYANSYVFTDPEFKFSFSYPDTWHNQSVDDDNVRVRIAAPVHSDLAECRLKADKDGRLQIYTKRHMASAVNDKLNAEFWQREFSEFEKPEIIDMWGSAGLAEGDATAARAHFYKETAFGKTKMTVIALSSIYGDDRFTMSCMSRAGAFAYYYDLFGNIMNTVVFDQRYTMFPGGFYRDFTSDKKGFYIPQRAPGDREEVKSGFWNPFGQRTLYQTGYGVNRNVNQ